MPIEVLGPNHIRILDEEEPPDLGYNNLALEDQLNESNDEEGVVETLVGDEEMILETPILSR